MIAVAVTDKIRAYNMDCMEFMKGVPDKYYDLCICDPPYGINVNVNMGRRKGDKKSDYHKFAGNDSQTPSIEYFEEIKRVSKNQIIWGGNYMIRKMSAAGFDIVSPCWLMWDKGFSEDVTFAQFELAWTSFNTSAKKFDKHPSQNNRIHPTQKPVALYKWLLDKYASPNDRILDTHGGSMSIAIACHDYGFELDIMELDKEYFDKGVDRVRNHVAQTKLF